MKIKIEGNIRKTNKQINKHKQNRTKTEKKYWLNMNELKLNKDKMEFLLLTMTQISFVYTPVLYHGSVCRTI